VRATNGLCVRFRQAEVLDLALLNQDLHRSCHIFDWHLGVNAVLIEEIDDVGLEPFERLLDMLRPTIEAWEVFKIESVFAAITTCLRNGARASPTSASVGSQTD
jgi:hypothetical protein